MIGTKNDKITASGRICEEKKYIYISAGVEVDFFCSRSLKRLLLEVV